MAISGVLRIPQSDFGDRFVLVQAQSKGTKPLDLKLVGTEGEAPYVAKLNHDRVSSLKISNSPVSDSEWQSILESFFQQQPLKNIQATAAVQSETSIAITLRKEVQGITQRLGTITLKHEPDEAIELFEWCATAAEAVQAGRQSTIEASDKINVLELSVKELREQLDELIKAKRDDETVQLQKFCDLLNEKKVKIREQQRAIASGSFTMQTKDAEKPSKEEAPITPRYPAKSRPGKRKANSSKPVSQIDHKEADVSDDEQLPAIKTELDDTEDGNTTDRTASTADEDDDEDDDEDQDMGNNDAGFPSSGTVHDEEKSHQAAPKKAPKQPPPRRDLPFLNKKVTKTAAIEESDSDDEL